MTPERSRWTPVTDVMKGGQKVDFGRSRSSWFKHSWRHALCSAAYYKFAAKIIGREKRVLDIGCGEGLGTWIIAKECGFAKGIDQDRLVITAAQKNWCEKRIHFECSSIKAITSEPWDALILFAADGGVPSTNRDSFFAAIKRNLSHDGIAIFGVPGLSKTRAVKTVGLRLEKEVKRHFHHTFMFSACDEMIHPGNLRAADYWISVGCRKKSAKKEIH